MGAFLLPVSSNGHASDPRGCRLLNFNTLALTLMSKFPRVMSNAPLYKLLDKGYERQDAMTFSLYDADRFTDHAFKAFGYETKSAGK